MSWGRRYSVAAKEMKKGMRMVITFTVYLMLI